MARFRTPSALVVALLASPFVVVGLIGYARAGARALPGLPPGPLGLAPESLAAAAVADLWGRFERDIGATHADLAQLRAWLDGQGLAVELELHPGVPMPPGSGRIVATREDLAGSTALSVWLAAPDEIGGAREELLGAWRVARRAWQGAGATLVARHLGCALCHVRVEPAPSDLRPVRVIALGDVPVRADARLTVLGTLQLGGALLGQGGAALAPHAVSGLAFAALGPDLRLAPPAEEARPLEAMDALRLTSCEGRLLGRTTGAPRTLARPMPRALPYFDDVSPTSPEGPGLAGGRGGTLSAGQRLGDDDAGTALPPMRSVKGHLWAVGTDAAPLTLEGDVTVAGDLVLAGLIRGRGTLRVQGSVVIPGSLHVDGHVAIVAGADVVAGSAFTDEGPVRFVREAAPGIPGAPDWVLAGRLRRMGARDSDLTSVEAFVVAAGAVVIVAADGRGGDVHVRGGLVADTLAIHAPGTLTVTDDPHARAEVACRAPRGLALERAATTHHGAGTSSRVGEPIHSGPPILGSAPSLLEPR